MKNITLAQSLPEVNTKSIINWKEVHFGIQCSTLFPVCNFAVRVVLPVCVAVIACVFVCSGGCWCWVEVCPCQAVAVLFRRGQDPASSIQSGAQPQVLLLHGLTHQSLPCQTMQGQRPSPWQPARHGFAHFSDQGWTVLALYLLMTVWLAAVYKPDVMLFQKQHKWFSGCKEVYNDAVLASQHACWLTRQR